MVAEASILGRVLDVLADIPSPQEVMAIKLTRAEIDRLSYLNDLRNGGKISPDEKAELDSYFLAEHLIQMAKARALHRLGKA